MAELQAGSVVGDCPEDGCNGTDSVVYSGDNQAVCETCGVVFECMVEDEPERPAPQPEPEPETLVLPTVAAPPPTDLCPPGMVDPKPPPPKLKDVIDPDPQKAKQELKLKTAPVNKAAATKGLGLPQYIKNSRPWRWAHDLHNKGNPYREGCKNHQIFNIFVEHKCTVEECVLECAKLGINERLSYLLTIYEVVHHCTIAGLLVKDEAGNISPARGNPKPLQ